MDVNDYSALVEIYSERLKCYFSDKVDLKIGIVTKPSTTWQMGLSDNLDTDMSGNGETLSEVTDAVIYHHYYIASLCLGETDIETRFNCAKNAFREHIEIDLVNNLDTLQGDFPNQNIWITEWNVLQGEDSKNNSYVNTILHASFVQEYALGILEYNSTHSNAVSMMTHHRIGDHNLWSVVQTRDGDNEEANFRSGAYAIQYLSKLYDNDSLNIIGNVLTDGSATFDAKEANFTTFHLNGKGINASEKLLLLFSNKTDAEISYSIPAMIDGINVDSATISFLTGDHLFTYGPRNTTAGKNRFIETGSLTHENSEINDLGYGNIDDQFYSTIDSTLSINDSNTITKISIGIIEIFLDKTFVNTTDIQTNYSNMIVYPNPVSETITLSLDLKKSEDVTFKLLSALGKKVFHYNTYLQQGNNEINIDTRKLTNGLYILTLENKSHLLSKKVIVEHN